jgi:outer membrane assembly lipoprotein YfiO
MKSKVRYILLCIILLYSWGCPQKSAKLQKSIAPPDKTLYETGMDYLKKNQYIKARLALQNLMSTYPDSEMAPDAVLAIGDSYYDEGGTQNLLLAEDKYKDFIVFFPTNPKAADAGMRIISLNYKMMRAPDRDQQYSFKTEEAARSFLMQWPDHDYAPIVKQYLLDVQEVLALQDLGVGKFYQGRNNLTGGRLRFEEIIKKYPSFSKMDEVLFLLANGQEKANNPEEAAINYGKILSAYPFSAHADEAKARLNSMGKPLPSVDTQLAASNQARVKPPEGFSPLRPFIAFGEALGFVGSKDLYREVTKAAEAEKAKTVEMAAKSAEGTKTGGDIQIQEVIRKRSDGTIQDSAMVANKPHRVVNALPSSGILGDVVFLDTDQKLYRYDGSQWIESAAAQSSDTDKNKEPKSKVRRKKRKNSVSPQ